MKRRSQLAGLVFAGAWFAFASASGMALAPKQTPTNLAPGEVFEVIGELYAYWVAKDMDARKPEIIDIEPLRLSGSEILSVQLLPRGSRIEIVRKMESRSPAFLYPERYLVVSPSIDNPAGLPIVLDIARGNEGTATPLNPKIYRPLRN